MSKGWPLSSTFAFGEFLADLDSLFDLGTSGLSLVGSSFS